MNKVNFKVSNKWIGFLLIVAMFFVLAIVDQYVNFTNWESVSGFWVVLAVLGSLLVGAFVLTSVFVLGEDSNDD